MTLQLGQKLHVPWGGPSESEEQEKIWEFGDDRPASLVWAQFLPHLHPVASSVALGEGQKILLSLKQD